MPTYEYECTKCRHNFEVFQAMSDEPVKKCPKCGKQVRRLILGGAGVIFKGSGFYVTDKAAGKSAVTTAKPANETPAKAPSEPPKSDSTPPNGPPGGEKAKDPGSSTDKSDSAKGKKNSAAKSA